MVNRDQDRLDRSANDERQLPTGWVWTTLGEVAELIGGGTPKRANPEYFTGDIVWLTPTEIPKVGVTVVRDSKERITDEGLRRSSARLVPSGSVLMTSRASIGYVAVAGTDLTTNQGFASFIPADGVFNFYLAYWLRANTELLLQRATGTTFKEITKSKLRPLEIPLAPLPEQHRIVAEIETQFTRLDAGVAALKRVQANLRRYVTSVLKAACEGRLVPTEAGLARQEGRLYEPADALLQRILAERRAKWEAENPKKKYKEPAAPDTDDLPELPEGWVWATVDRVAENLDSMRVPVSKKVREERAGEIPYFGANGQVGWIDDFLFDEPLVLVVEDETFTGREKPFSYKITGKTWVNNHAHVLRSTGAVDTDFLNYSLMFYPFTPLTTGTTGRRKLTKSALMAAAYPLPPLVEQHRIIAEVERRLSLVDDVEATVEANLKRAERLRQSILKRAFEGRLVARDPDDEPAGVLLERIQAQRNDRKTQGHLKSSRNRQHEQLNLL